MPRQGAAAQAISQAPRAQLQVPLLQSLFFGFWASVFLFATLAGMFLFKTEPLMVIFVALFGGTISMALLIPAGFLSVEQFESIARAFRLLRTKEKP